MGGKTAVPRQQAVSNAASTGQIKFSLYDTQRKDANGVRTMHLAINHSILAAVVSLSQETLIYGHISW